MGNLQSSHEEILDIWHAWRSLFEQVHVFWKDDNSDRFENEYVKEINETTKEFLTQLKELAEVCDKISKELSKKDF